MTSRLLRERGGDWCSIVLTPEDQAGVGAMVDGPVDLMADDGSLPYADKAFAIAVVSSSVISRITDDDRLVMACHRVLQDGGVLVMCSLREKNFGAIPRVRRFLGVSATDCGLARAGYTEKQMFELLRCGFDVLEMRSYLRFFVELARAFSDRRRIYSRRRGLRGWVYQIAYQLDLLLFWSRGYMLASRSRRRTWRQKVKPGLCVGGVISGAILSKASR